MVQTTNAVKAGAVPGVGWLRRHLGRRTSSGEFIPALDGLRCVALLMVVLVHVVSGVWVRDTDLQGYNIDWVQAGQHGLPVFFVISGLILGIPFARRAKGGPPVSLKHYFLRRLTRIEPPYLLALTAFLVINATVGQADPAELAPHYAAGLVYAHGFAYQTLNPVMEVAWSLEVEVQFYLVMPLLATVYLLRDAGIRRRLMIAGIVASTGLAHALTIGNALNDAPGEAFPLAGISLAGFLNFFLWGMLLAELYVHDDWKRRAPSRMADIAFLAGLAALWLIQPEYGAVRTLLLPLACVIVVAGAIRGRLVRAFLERPLVFVIGGMSYSIYLLHFGIIHLIGYRVTDSVTFASPILEFVARAGVLAGVTLIISTAYFVLVERPFMRPDWPSRALDRVPQPIGSVAALLGSRRYAKLPMHSFQLIPAHAMVSGDEGPRRARA